MTGGLAHSVGGPAATPARGRLVLSVLQSSRESSNGAGVNKDVQTATCKRGFEIERRNGVDRCIKRERDLLGNLQTMVDRQWEVSGAHRILAGDRACSGKGKRGKEKKGTST